MTLISPIHINHNAPWSIRDKHNIYVDVTSRTYMYYVSWHHRCIDLQYDCRICTCCFDLPTHPCKTQVNQCADINMNVERSYALRRQPGIHLQLDKQHSLSCFWQRYIIDSHANKLGWFLHSNCLSLELFVLFAFYIFD